MFIRQVLLLNFNLGWFKFVTIDTSFLSWSKADLLDFICIIPALNSLD